MEKDNNILTIRNFKKIEILYIHAKMINLIINLDIGKKIFYIFFINYLQKDRKHFQLQTEITIVLIMKKYHHSQLIMSKIIKII